MPRRGGPCGKDQRGLFEDGVVAVLQAGGAGVVGGTRHLHAPPAVWPDVAAHAHRRAALLVCVGVGQGAALFDVQLDERVNATERLGVGGDGGGVATRSSHGLRHGHALGVGQGEGSFGLERPGDDPGAGAGDAEAGALLITEADHSQGSTRLNTLGLQRIHCG